MADTVPRRGPALTTFAVLFGLLAVSNLLKPLQIGGARTGFVFFGQRLSGTPNAILGPLFGLYLLVYAVGIWRLRRFALPMAYAYTAYVIANLVAFTVRGEPAPEPGMGPFIFGIVYAAVAIGVSGGAALLLARRKADLG